MTTEPDTNDNIASRHLVPLKEFLIDLYKAGGIPLVLLGLAAANLFLPFTGYDNLERIGSSAVLALLAVNFMYFSSKLVFERQKAEMETKARQREIVIKAICDIATNTKEDSAVVEKKIDALKKVLSDIVEQDVIQISATIPDAEE